MLWKGRRQSENVLDVRRSGGRGGGKAVGIGTLVVGAVVYALMGGNPLDYLAQNSGQLQYEERAQPGATGAGTATDSAREFVGVVLGDTEDVWNAIFKQSQAQYREPQLVLFSRAVRSACGNASSSVGPFYCPGDQRVYLDVSFFDQMANRLGAGGDFAAAYVIAHEVGHHVQNLLGIERGFRAQQAGVNARDRNRLSVQMELQADCLAGIWAKHTQDAKQVVEAGDIDEAMGAAAAVGDDRLQEAARGEVVPDSFTHGSSAQRVQAFRLGFGRGEPRQCLDTYQPVVDGPGSGFERGASGSGDW